uniref:SH2 domain-containing protein n=1 Tax=Globodera rostochiensis TaxID=31243 RepID=A0A914I7P8_GLORO
MSALQEILEKGYVDPELLEQLGEEQKQILFIKMREEQIRKWRLYEAEIGQRETDEARKSGGKRRSQETSEKSGIRRVQWRTGRDGNVWVWVMGEHPDDISIEQILDKESEEMARRMAAKQIMQTLRKADDELRLADDLPNLLEREEALKAELADMELNRAETSNGCGMEDVENGETKSNSHSPYDDLMHDHRLGLHFPLPFNGPSVQPTTSNGGTNRLSMNYQNHSIAPSPRRQQPPFIKDGTNSGREQLEFYDNVDAFYPPATQHHISNNLHFNARNGQQLHAFQVLEADDRPKPPPVPEKPAFLRRTVSNSMVMNNDSSKNSDGGGVVNELPALEMFAFNTLRSYIPDAEVEKRQSKIFEQLREQRERFERAAEEEARREQARWEEQERRSREAEESIRRIAQKAREQHRKCLRTSDSLLPLFQRNGGSQMGGGTAQSLREAMKALPRPPKPKSRHSIVQWFCSSELDQWGRKKPPVWFHGIISRLDADRLLDAKPSGAFLVRVTERIFGYTVSYRTVDGMTKNFLIERISDGYQFMGTNQLVHSSLADLVNHHQSVPITAKGGEMLREPVGQRTADGQLPDYAELFKGTQDERNDNNDEGQQIANGI